MAVDYRTLLGPGWPAYALLLIMITRSELGRAWVLLGSIAVLIVDSTNMAWPISLPQSRTNSTSEDTCRAFPVMMRQGSGCV